MDLSIFALSGKVAIVTGGGRGIGRAISLGFARAGADVIVAARTAAEIEDTATVIQAEGGKALPVVTDVRNTDQVANLRDKALDSFGHIDILVNNAGGHFYLPVLETSIKAWETLIRENLNSVFICSKIIGEIMVNQKTGNIINIGSINGIGPSPNSASYGAAKAGIINFTKTLAVEWAPYNIRVNAIAPGAIITEGSTNFAQKNPDRWEPKLKKILLGRFGKPEDIAGLAIFLASNASSYITGQTIEISGGITSNVSDR